MKPDPDTHLETPLLGPRGTIAMVAMHGELASQNGKVDWSGRPAELAALSVAYADALLAAIGEAEYVGPIKSDASKG